MRRGGLLVPLLLVPLAGCGADEPPYTGLAEDACAGLDAQALARSSYPGTTVRADDRAEGRGREQTRVCGLELTGPAGRTLSISVELQTFDEEVPDEDFDRLRDVDARSYQGDVVLEDSATGRDLDGWWADAWASTVRWTEPGRLAGVLDTAAVRADNLLVTVLVVDRSLPAAAADATARVHDETVRALLGRAKGLARRR